MLIRSRCAVEIPCVCLLSCAGDHRYLPSFPTRRSSDLKCRVEVRVLDLTASNTSPTTATSATPLSVPLAPVLLSLGGCARSEEHTSELQSRRELVCRLLLEKKNAKPTLETPGSQHRSPS